MLKINDVIIALEKVAPLQYQESYDNSGLITGDRQLDCTGVLCTLDTTENVVDEAIKKRCNLIVSHHPIIFRGIKSISAENYAGRALIKAIKNDIALYAYHTNLDNVAKGVSDRMADKIELINRHILAPANDTLRKLQTFVPASALDPLRSAIFSVGAGAIGNYTECSFSVLGEGTFKAGEGSDPYVGTIGTRHSEQEYKVEIVFPVHLQNSVIKAMRDAHPYEEVAFDMLRLSNPHPEIGSGIIGELPVPLSVDNFLKMLGRNFLVPVVKYTETSSLLIKKVALCGGTGSFLTGRALSAGADAFVTADIKYHEFFDGEGKLLICDIGHFESEQYTIELIHDILVKNFTTFAILKSEVKTNPVNYFLS